MTKYTPQERDLFIKRGQVAGPSQRGQVIGPCKVAFDWAIVNAEGAWFCLIREPHHTDQDIADAKAYLRSERDVVRLEVGALEN